MPFSVFGPSVGSSICSDAVQVPDGHGSIDQEAAVSFRSVITNAGDGVGGELADNFFENIFQRGQALDVTVLVDNQTDASALTLEVQQLTVQWCVFRDEHRFPYQCFQRFHVQLVAHHQGQYPAQVNKPRYVIDAVSVNRQARVLAGSDLANDVVPVVFKVDAG